MSNHIPYRRRKSTELRALLHTLTVRRDALRASYRQAVAMNASDEVIAHIVRDGTATGCNIELIEKILRERREWARKQSRVRAHRPPVAPEREPDYDEPLGQPSWDDLHLAVGTWS